MYNFKNVDIRKMYTYVQRFEKIFLIEVSCIYLIQNTVKPVE